MHATSPGSSSYKWWVVGMLWLVCFFNYADRQAIYAVFPKLKEEFGFDKAQLGLIGSAFMWVYAAGAPLAGLICDRFRRKDLILGGCVFWSLVTVLTGGCSKLWHFVTVRALEGFGETFYFPASMALTSDYHGPRTRSRALSFHQSSVYIGTILGSWIGALFAQHLGWRYGFYFFGGFGLVLALVLYRFLREPPRGAAETPAPGSSLADEPDCAAARGSGPPPSAACGRAPPRGDERLPVGETLRLIFRAPGVAPLMLAFLCANFVATIFLTWTPTFLFEKFHFQLASAGLSGAIFIHLSSACSVPVAGWLADRLTRRLPNGRLVVQGAGLCAGAGFVFLVGSTDSTATLLFAMTMFGLCKGCYDSGIFASLYDTVEPRARGTAAGLMNTIGWGGGAVGPLYVGLASKYGAKATEVENMSDAIAWCAAVYVVAAGFIGLAMYLRRRRAVGLAPGGLGNPR